MITKRRRHRRPGLESLEARLCMAAPPTALAGSPLALPTGGAWTQTPFVASPIFADLNGDGKDEVIVSVAGGKLIAYDLAANGALTKYQEYDTGSQANIKATPIVVTLAGGRKAIFAGLGRDENVSGSIEDGRIFGWDAQTGQVLPGWPQSSGVNLNDSGGTTGIIGPLTSGDLVGDGEVDIVATSYSNIITAFRADGSVLWKYKADDTMESGAVIGDLDRDGKPEVVFGSDSTASIFYGNGGWVNILNNNGALKYRYKVGEAVWSSPVLADLYNDGYLEIVVGTGITYDQNGVQQFPGARAAGNQIIALNYLGQVLPGWPYHTTSDDTQARQALASPVVADINGDGKLDVVEVDLGGFLHVVGADGKDLPGWAGGKQVLQSGQAGHGDVFSSAIVADVDGNGTPDIIATDHYFVTAFDSSGAVLWTMVAPSRAAGVQADPVIATPAVGRLTGSGGYQLALLGNVFDGLDKPELLGLYQLPNSSLAPPWPMLRRSASGVAIAQSPSFEQTFIQRAYASILGRAPDPGGLASFLAGLNAGTLSRTQVVQALANSPEGQTREVNSLYRLYLRRAPDAGGLAFVLNYLRSATIQDQSVNMLSSPEYAGLHGNTPTGIVTGYYQDVLGRAPDAGGLASWVARIQGGASYAQIARAFLTTDEALAATTAPIYAAGLPGLSADPASRLTINADLRANRRQEDVFADLLASGGNYASTNLLDGWIRSVYRDVLNRDASSPEIASWLQQFYGAGLSITQFAQAIINSKEGRTRFITEEYQALLGRAPDPGGLASFLNYGRRTDVIVGLVSSAEYFNRNGGTVASYVQAAYLAIGGYTPAASDAAAWVQRINSGESRAVLASTLAASREYAVNTGVNDIFRYIPDESQGVLRSGTTAIPAGQITNPDPGLLNYTANLIQAGGEEGALVTLLTSPQYFSKSAYYRGYFVARNIRA